jgi:hypothetical protein
MRSLISLALGSVLVLTLGVGSVLAAGPDHQMISGSDTDPDFCGTGQSVDVTFRGVFNGWGDKAYGHISNTWTNPDNGVSVVDSFSGGGKSLGVIDDGDGAYTIVRNRQGLPEQLRLANGPLLTLDAGLLIFYDHFDADDNYLGTDVVVRGPHPDVDSGFTLWCEVMIEALGL